MSDPMKNWPDDATIKKLGVATIKLFKFFSNEEILLLKIKGFESEANIQAWREAMGAMDNFLNIK